MDKHFTITIHDDNGVKQFNIHKIMKKAIFYAIGFIISIFIIASGTILYLNENIEKIEQKRVKTQKAYNNLKEQHKSLQEQMEDTQISLVEKKEELDELSDSLTEIEKLIGLKPIEQLPLTKRITITKLNSQQRAVLLKLIPNGSPIEFKGITSKFGYRKHPLLNKKEFHRGLDMKAKMNTPVYAPADGVVEWSGYHKRSGFGNLVILEHIYGFKTYFGHLNKVVIKSGNFVKKGDLIAYTGNSGLSNGPHLHYEVRFIQRALNPYYFINWNQKNYNEIFKQEKKVPWQSLITAMSQIRLVKQNQTQQ